LTAEKVVSEIAVRQIWSGNSEALGANLLLSDLCWLQQNDSVYTRWAGAFWALI